MLYMLGHFRDAVIVSWQHVPFDALLYKIESKLLEAIDEAAE